MLLNKVVIAEDDDAIQHMLGAFLGDAGFLCLRAVNGRDALRLVRTQQPDVVILDIMMPEMDGYEVARRLKADPLSATIPILMLTALGAVEDQVKGLETGADDYISKPFDMRVLVARVQALVRARRRERQRDPATGLPTGQALEQHVESRLKSGQPFALLHVSVDGFPAFAQRFGFKQADEALATIGRLIGDTMRSGPASFTAHVGGSDFVLACDAGEAEAIATEVLSGFDGTKDSLAPEGSADAPALTLRIAGVDTGRKPVASVEALSKALAEAGRSGTGARVRWAV